MDEMTLLGIGLIVVAIPGLLLGLALLLGKWSPPIKSSANPERSRKVLGLAFIGSDAAMLAAGVVLVATRI
jgi:hypothetical protein